MISQAISVDSIDSNREELVEEVTDLRLENRQLKERVAWFEKQLFGSKSEKRHVAPPEQTSLLGKRSNHDVLSMRMNRLLNGVFLPRGTHSEPNIES